MSRTDDNNKFIDEQIAAGRESVHIEELPYPKSVNSTHRIIGRRRKYLLLASKDDWSLSRDD